MAARLVEGAEGAEAVPPEAASPEGLRQDSVSFKVRLERVGGLLGVAYRAEDVGLRVTAIVTGSGADAWNRTADADRRLCVGDVVTEVNDARGAEATELAKCADCQALVAELVGCEGVCTLTVVRFGPRWHVEGVTARCLELIDLACDHGLKMELIGAEGPALVSDEVLLESELKAVDARQFLFVLCVVALPSLLVLVLCSGMGLGFVLFSTFASSNMNTLGNIIMLIAALAVIGMYIVDVHKNPNLIEKGLTLFFIIYAMAIGAIIKCRFYPQAPLVMVLFHLPLFIGVLRATALKRVKRASFYRCISLCTLLTGIATLVVWLAWMNIPAWDGTNQYNDATKEKMVERSSMLYQETQVLVDDRWRSLHYHWDCKDKDPRDFDIVYGRLVDNGYELTPDEKKYRRKACGQVQTIWFLIWLSPFIVTMTYVVVAAFCAINGVVMDADDASKTEKALKQFVSMVIVLLMCMWVAASVAGASMRLTGTIMAFCGAGLVALFMWVYFEVDRTLVRTTLTSSKIMAQLIMLVTNDWFRACFLLGPGTLLPVMFCIELLKQKVRRIRGVTASPTWLTPEASNAIEFFQSWRWPNIFIKANWLVIIYWTLSVGIAKITVLFLAWLSETLDAISQFHWVILIFFAVGFAMFMLPPVPGIQLYITSGLILASQARSIPNIGFVAGIFIAIALCLVLKLAAVCGQYAIGYIIGRSVKVQQLVGIDQLPLRAVERILSRPGYGLGKVSLLVGGPDWPTSVLCGILRVSLCQCLWRAVPVVFVITPSVLAGAFMAGPEADIADNSRNMWDALSNTALAVSGVGQLVCGVVAMYHIQDTIARDSEELAMPRLEHDQVRWLTCAEQDIRDCRTEVLDWRTLPRFWWRFIVVTTVMMITSFFVFMMMDELCFHSFQMSDKIGDPDGLQCPHDLGCALLRLVLMPFGWCALAFFGLATVLQCVFVRYVSIKAEERYTWKRANGLLGRRSRRSSHASSIGEPPAFLRGGL